MVDSVSSTGTRPTWGRASRWEMDDGRYARLLADTLIHQGEPDETFRGQQQAVLTRSASR